jgi:1,4-dihydroxy-2-naphthoate octaprenyltransferase
MSKFKLMLADLGAVWVSMRPKTLWAAVGGVVIGAGQARLYSFSHPETVSADIVVGFAPLFALATLTAIFLQIAVNYANDYYDIRSGVDAKKGERLPVDSARRRFMFSVTMSILVGVMLILYAPIPLAGRAVLAVLGVASLLAVWLYSGSKHPYGHKGWAEPISGIFFGPVSILGTFYILTAGSIPSGGELVNLLLKSLSFALIVAAMMMVDNIRDIETDPEAGKHTLMSKIGFSKSLVVYKATVGLALFIGVIVMKLYFLTIAVTLFALVINAYQYQNLAEKNFRKVFNFHCILAVALVLMLMF